MKNVTFQLRIYTKLRRRPFVLVSTKSLIDDFNRQIKISDFVCYNAISFMRDDFLYAFEYQKGGKR